MGAFSQFLDTPISSFLQCEFNPQSIPRVDAGMVRWPATILLGEGPGKTGVGASRLSASCGMSSSVRDGRWFARLLQWLRTCVARPKPRSKRAIHGLFHNLEGSILAVCSRPIVLSGGGGVGAQGCVFNEDAYSTECEPLHMLNWQ